MTDTRRNAMIDAIIRPRSFGYLHLLLASIAGAFVGAVLMSMMPWTGSFDECFLREMRGQRLVATQSAIAVCRQRYPK
jgi:hypothetical protein